MAVVTRLVDDDVDSNELIGRMLEINNIDYVPYSSPEEFLKSDEEKEVCLFDYRFLNSGINGVELAEDVKIKYPDAQILIITGYVDDADFINLLNVKAFKYINKRDLYYLDKLLKAVQQAISVYEGIIQKKRSIKDFGKKMGFLDEYGNT